MMGVRIQILIAAAALGAASSSVAEAQSWLSEQTQQARQPRPPVSPENERNSRQASQATVGRCLKGDVSVSQQQVNEALGPAQSLMNDYWMLAGVSDAADVTPAFQSLGTEKWVQGWLELTSSKMKRVRDEFARNSSLALAAQPSSFAVSGAGDNSHARGVWAVYERTDPSRIAGYYVVDFTRAMVRWGISRLELIKAPAERPIVMPFCVRPGDIEVAASTRVFPGPSGKATLPTNGVASAPISRAPQPSTSMTLVQTDVGQEYRIARGDKVKISTFGEDRFSGEFLVHGDGKITFPMFGDIPAAGLTIPQLVRDLKKRLGPDYLRDPQVTGEVISFRPVYILGEVSRPGEYAYTEGMTMYALIAQAGGFSYRANHKHAFVRHDGQVDEQRVELESATPVRPGDTIRVPQRIF
jgi:protein involved in polysaccharide export with SLBB domain